MKILHKLSILCILFVSLPAWAQNPAGIVVTGLSKKAFTSSVRRQMAVQTFKQGILVRPPFRPQPVDLVSLRPFVAGVGEVTPRISSVQLESPVSPTPRSEIVSETVTPQTSRYESPLLPFLKEEWELPPIPPRVPPAYEERMPHTYVGWSLESLRRECSSLGILPQDWETYTRQELAYLLSTYKSLAGSAHAPSRFQPAAADNGKSQLEKELDVKAWAQQQPDFIKSY